MDHDPVRHPSHYTWNPEGIEAIQITSHLNYCMGNAVKYLLRADFHGTPDEDLAKAAQYIEFEQRRRVLMEQKHKEWLTDLKGLFEYPPETGGDIVEIPYISNLEAPPRQVSTVLTPSLGGDYLEEHEYVGPLEEYAPGEYRRLWDGVHYDIAENDE